ncbi:MAG: glutamate racemase [Flavobacteriales bacterium]|nr:glutamate racemase [Flavobacteriales bacterium]
MDKRPIGIFDSGIGGLTVANAIRKKLPNESLVYFGDTAHMPYGDKSPELIRHYSARIAHYLMTFDCKMIVIACNTASSHAFSTVAAVVGPDIPVVNVIDPVVDYVVKHHNKDKVGVIGTKGTIESRVYPRRIQKADKSIKVASLATPLLAPMIEEGFVNNMISRTVIHSYLDKTALRGIDALILGCTHYPLIRKEVASYYKNPVEILDSTLLVAEEVEQILTAKDMLNDASSSSHRFMVSDYTEAFEKSTRLFFKEKLELTESRIWDNRNFG